MKDHCTLHSPERIDTRGKALTGNFEGQRLEALSRHLAQAA